MCPVCLRVPRWDGALFRDLENEHVLAQRHTMMVIVGDAGGEVESVGVGIESRPCLSVVGWPVALWPEYAPFP